MLSASELKNARRAYSEDGIIAYPTEAVYGLGCNPESEVALEKIFSIKNRSSLKGLIIVAANFEQLSPYIETKEIKDLDQILSTWPGPFTWIFPSKASVSDEITGGRTSIAVRVSGHPIVQSLCLALGPLVSTSANPSNAEAARSAVEVKNYFPTEIDCLIDAPLGDQKKPTEIRDAITKKILRKA